jgi:lipopolysaccharide biosynthesis glycosyltransferase
MENPIQKSQEVVSIAFCLDNNYMQHLTVTIYSICENLKKGRNLDVYVVHNSLSQVNQDRLVRDIAIFENVNIFFVSDQNDYDTLYVSSVMTQSTYLKINLPNTLPKDLKKVLYIDCDIVAAGDISELYDLNPKYIMAARDTNLYLEKYYDMLFWRTNNYGYFNAGVMFMNLETLRQIDAAGDIMEYSVKYSKFFDWYDQTGFNYTLADKYEPIHPKYNFLQCMYSLRDMKQSIYPESEYAEAKKSPVLIHYAGSTYKPWVYSCIGPLIHLYFICIQKTSYRNFVLVKTFSGFIKKCFNYTLLLLLPTPIMTFLFHIQWQIFLLKNKKNAQLVPKNLKN